MPIEKKQQVKIARVADATFAVEPTSEISVPVKFTIGSLNVTVKLTGSKRVGSACDAA
jgi:hypothetical protein